MAYLSDIHHLAFGNSCGTTTMETVTDLIFGGSKITADGDCNNEIKRLLLLGKKLQPT